MPPVNRGRSSRYSKCPRCSHHFKDIDGHVSRIHQTTLSELHDDEHFSILDNQQDNPDPHQQEISNSCQETPTPNSHSDQDNQN
ncbi:28922_t:CDS:2, partial [Racocetra persica]